MSAYYCIGPLACPACRNLLDDRDPAQDQGNPRSSKADVATRTRRGGGEAQETVYMTVRCGLSLSLTRFPNLAGFAARNTPKKAGDFDSLVRSLTKTVGHLVPQLEHFFGFRDLRARVKVAIGTGDAESVKKQLLY